MSIGALGLPSIIKIKIGKDTYKLDSKDLIKSGGEASVFLLTLNNNQRVAVKIILPSMRSEHRFMKLQAMVNRNPHPPSKTMKPLSLVTDSSDVIIGFTMSILERSQYDELSFWLKPDWRDNINIQTADIMSVFAEIRSELTLIHQLGYVIGDFNAGGVLIMKKELWSPANANDRIRFVDVDSFAFDHYPCAVYTLAYLDYKIPHKVSKNGIDLPKGFSAKNDIFAFNALLFEALTNVNVYSGYSPQIMSVSPKSNFTQGWTVLHPSMEYPDDVNVVPFDSLPNPFQDFFKNAFLTSERVLFPQNFLNGANVTEIHQIVTHDRKVAITESPQGFSRLQDLMQAKINDNVHILDVAIVENGVHILYHSDAIPKNKLGYMALINNSLHEHVFIYNNSKQSDFFIVSAYAVAQITKKPKLSDVDIYNVRNSGCRSFVTANGIMGKPVVAGGLNELYVATSMESVVAHTLLSGDSNWRYVQPITPRTSEIKSDVVTGNIAGYTLIMSIYTWLFVRGKNSYNVMLPQLADTETMIDWSVRFVENRACVVRLTEYKGARRMYVDEVNVSSSYTHEERVVNSRLADNEFLKPIDGFEYGLNKQGEGMIFYTTPRGLVKENLTHGQITLFHQTKGIIKQGMKIRRFGDGLIIYSRSNVLYVKF